MKAIDSIRNKIKRPSQSAVLFWVGLFLAFLVSVLQLIIPGAQLVLFLVAVVGFVLTGWQKIVGDREQRQERKRNETVAQDKAIHSTELRVESNLNNRAPDTMPTGGSQAAQSVMTPDELRYFNGAAFLYSTTV